MQTCDSFGMRLTDPKTPEEWACILNELNKTGKASRKAKNAKMAEPLILIIINLMYTPLWS
jgi:hypothetical protein